MYVCHTALQVLLFTATMPEAVQEAGAKWQRKPVSIHLAPGEMSISQTITQVLPPGHPGITLGFFSKHRRLLTPKCVVFYFLAHCYARPRFCAGLSFNTHMNKQL